MKIPYSKQSIDETDIQAVSEVLRSPFLSQGPQVTAFEEALKRYLDVEDAVVVSNGTAALHLSYLALGVKNIRVFTSPITFVATANMAIAAGAEVTFVDVNPNTGLMDIGTLEQTLAKYASEKSKKVIVPVTLNGAVPDLVAIKELADRYQAAVIEDAAHSLGAEYMDGKEKLKSASCQHTEMAILSFHPVKSICCAEGGAVITKNKAYGETVRLLRNHGLVRRTGTYLRDQAAIGWNYRLTDLQCALGVSQLKRLPFFINKRRALAKRYREKLAQDPYNQFLAPISEIFGNAYHLFVIHFLKNEWRESAYTFLQTKGIETQVHYPPLYRLQEYEKRLGTIRLPGAEAYFKGCLSIPLYPELTEAEQDYVLETLAECCNKF